MLKLNKRCEFIVKSKNHSKKNLSQDKSMNSLNSSQLDRYLDKYLSGKHIGQRNLSYDQEEHKNSTKIHGRGKTVMINSSVDNIETI